MTIGIEFIGERIKHKSKNKIIYTGTWITGELKRTGIGCYINDIEVAPETVGQVAHKRFNEEKLKGDNFHERINN